MGESNTRKNCKWAERLLSCVFGNCRFCDHLFVYRPQFSETDHEQYCSTPYDQREEGKKGRDTHTQKEWGNQSIRDQNSRKLGRKTKPMMFKKKSLRSWPQSFLEMGEAIEFVFDEVFCYFHYYHCRCPLIGISPRFFSVSLPFFLLACLLLVGNVSIQGFVLQQGNTQYSSMLFFSWFFNFALFLLSCDIVSRAVHGCLSPTSLLTWCNVNFLQSYLQPHTTYLTSVFHTLSYVGHDRFP